MTSRESSDEKDRQRQAARESHKKVSLVIARCCALKYMTMDLEKRGSRVLPALATALARPSASSSHRGTCRPRRQQRLRRAPLRWRRRPTTPWRARGALWPRPDEPRVGLAPALAARVVGGAHRPRVRPCERARRLGKAPRPAVTIPIIRVCAAPPERLRAAKACARAWQVVAEKAEAEVVIAQRDRTIAVLQARLMGAAAGPGGGEAREAWA
mgnify:CR=1 FL=1